MGWAPPYARLGEVDTLDGFLIVLSPWAVENLRFDEDLGQFHGYDFDFCLQVRAAGRKAVTADFRAIHHHALEPFDDPEPWIAAHVRLAEKWEDRIPGVGTGPGTWEERALRAEAERDVARVIDHATRSTSGLAPGARAALDEMRGKRVVAHHRPLRRVLGDRSSGARGWPGPPLRARLARIAGRSR